MCTHTCRRRHGGTKILAICAVTAATDARGGGGRRRGIHRRTHTYTHTCMYEEGVPLPRASLIYFHYIFAIGALRACTFSSGYSLFNFQPSYASRCNFAGFFFFFYPLFSSWLLSRILSCAIGLAVNKLISNLAVVIFKTLMRCAFLDKIF